MRRGSKKDREKKAAQRRGCKVANSDEPQIHQENSTQPSVSNKSYKKRTTEKDKNRFKTNT